jgi:hypothetical protein
MTAIPDRLSADSASPYFVKQMPVVRITVDGIEFTGRVLEYCISKGWAKVITIDKETGKAVQSVRGGRASTKMKHGTVVVWRAVDPIPEGALADDQPREMPVEPPEPELPALN